MGELKRFADTRKRWTVSLRQALGSVTLLLLATLVVVGINYTPKSWGFNSSTSEGIQRYNGIFEAIALISFAIGLVFRYINRRHVVYLVPEWRKDSRGLSQQSRRDLMVALIAAVASAAILALAGLWAGIFTK